MSGSEDQAGREPLVMLAAKPGRPRDSLHFLLKTVPGISVVGSADDSSSALRMVSEQHPALVLLDTNLPGEGTVAVLKWIKTNGSGSRCLVLSDDLGQQQEAQAAGADAALVKGYPTERLFDIIEELLLRQGSEQ